MVYWLLAKTLPKGIRGCDGGVLGNALPGVFGNSSVSRLAEDRSKKLQMAACMQVRMRMRMRMRMRICMCICMFMFACMCMCMCTRAQAVPGRASACAWTYATRAMSHHQWMHNLKSMLAASLLHVMCTNVCMNAACIICSLASDIGRPTNLCK